MTIIPRPARKLLRHFYRSFNRPFPRFPVQPRFLRPLARVTISSPSLTTCNLLFCTDGTNLLIEIKPVPRATNAFRRDDRWVVCCGTNFGNLDVQVAHGGEVLAVSMQEFSVFLRSIFIRFERYRGNDDNNNRKSIRQRWKLNMKTCDSRVCIIYHLTVSLNE